MKNLIGVLIILIFNTILFSRGVQEPFHETVDYVDMDKFSGDWYVIALIPTPFEKGAYNGIENYSIDDKGLIRVEYTFQKGEDKPKNKIMYQKGWIYNNQTNSEWRVQPLWPFKLPYYVMELDAEYSYSVIGTNNYKYLWIMNRKPMMDSDKLESIINRMVNLGFEKDDIILMKQNAIN